MKRRRFLLIVLALVAATAVLAWSLRQHLLPAAARWLDVGTVPRPVHFVFILPGEQNIRPFVAAALVKTGFAERAVYPKNLVSPDATEGVRPSNAEIIRRVLEHRGLAEEQIVAVEGDTTTTEEDLQALGRYLQSHHGANAAVVTTDYHTRRVRWLAKRLLGDQADRLRYVSAPPDEFSADNWWRREKGFFAITSEYLKLAHTASQSASVRWTAAALLIAVLSGAGYVCYRSRRAPVLDDA